MPVVVVLEGWAGGENTCIPLLRLVSQIGGKTGFGNTPGKLRSTHRVDALCAAHGRNLASDDRTVSCEFVSDPDPRPCEKESANANRSDKLGRRAPKRLLEFPGARFD